MKKSNVVRISEAGFTLVELMIVVAIIGILAAIAIPNFQKYQAKARQKEAQLGLSSIYTAETANFGEYSTYSSCLVNIGYRPEGDPTAAGLASGRRVYAIGVANTQCTGATWGGSVAACSIDGANRACAVPTAGQPLNTSPNQYAATIAANPRTPTVAAGAQLVGIAMTATSFTAVAAGSNGTALNTFDTWTINNNKILANSINAL